MYKSGEHGLPIEKESKLDRGIENYPKSKSYSMGHTEFAKQRNYGKDDHEGFYTQRNISASPFIQGIIIVLIASYRAQMKVRVLRIEFSNKWDSSRVSRNCKEFSTFAFKFEYAAVSLLARG